MGDFFWVYLYFWSFSVCFLGMYGPEGKDEYEWWMWIFGTIFGFVIIPAYLLSELLDNGAGKK